MKPRIGIASGLEFKEFAEGPRERIFVNRGYLDCILAAGGLPFVVPPLAAPCEYFDLADGWLITGGDDLPSAWWGEPTHPEVSEERPERVNFERALLETLPADMPVLGICFGSQIMNVVRGGSLHQHLPDVVGHDGHRGGTLETLTIVPGTPLAAIVGETVQGKSYHHQAVNRVGEGLTVMAHAADGTIEGVADTTDRWWMGVQWHPERTPDDAATQALFCEFVGRARARMESRKEAKV